MKKGIRLKTKITAIGVATAVCMAILVGLLSLNVAKKIITANAQQNLQDQTAIMAEKIDLKVADNMQLAKTIASNSIFTDPEATVEDKSSYAYAAAGAAGFYSGLYVSKEGHVVIPARNGKNSEFDIDTNDSAYKNALNGETTYRPDRSVNGTSLMASGGTPIYNEDGSVQAVFVFTTNIDEFGNLLNEDTEAFIVDVNGDYLGSTKAAAFKMDENDEVIANDDGTLAIVEDASKPVNLSISPITASQTDSSYSGLAALIKNALSSGNGTEEYTSMITGNAQIAAYATVKSTGWEVFYLVDKDEVLSSLVTLRNSILLISLILVVLSVIANIIVSNILLAPLSKATGNLESIVNGIKQGEGDLTQRLERRSDDEIGQIVSGINGYTEVLQGITTKIKDQVENLQDSVASITDSVTASNEQATDNSAIVEELAASMEQVNKSTEYMKQSLDEFRTAIQTISDQTDNGTSLARNISEQADSIKDSSAKKQSDTKKMLDGITDALNTSIEKSAQVSRIGELTGDIQNIASQTNLLSLNASIEAARAGEAGRGFAVVADEISKLAASTSETAKSIQTISDDVTESVEELVNNTKQLLEYITTDVLKDYDGMVQTGDDYKKASEDISGMMMSLSQNVESMLANVSQFADQIEFTVDSISECSKGVSEAANNTEAFVGSFADISNDVEINKNVAEELKKELEKFKKL